MLDFILKITKPFNDFIHHRVDVAFAGRTARELQDIQHLVGGFYNISLLLVGVNAGQRNWWLSLFFGLLTVFISRFSSEIAFQVQIRIVSQYSH